MPVRKIAALKAALERRLWTVGREERASARLDLIGLGRWLYVLGREMTNDELNSRAMGLVYTTLLSLTPLLAVSFSVLKAFGVHNQLEPLLLEVLSPLGEKAPELVRNIIGFVEKVQVGVLGSVGLAVLLYSVVALLGKIEGSFNQIWRTSESRGWIRRFSDYLSLMLIGPVLIFSAFGLTASMASTAIGQRIISLEPFGTAYYLLGLIVPYLLIVAAFTFAYCFIPNTRVEVRSALIGGVAACLAWKAVGGLFRLFVAQSAGYSAIYSGFAIVILFMIWLYVSWLILLLGGVVSFYCQHPRYLAYKSRTPHLSYRECEHLVFWLIYLVGKSYHRGDPPWTQSALADAVSMPWEPVFQALRLLQQAHLLVAVHGEPESFVPARDLETISLHEIHQAVRTFAEGGNGRHPQDDGPKELRELITGVESAVSGVLEGRSLRDLVQ